MKLRDIKIIEKDNNKKGDLFGRLMGDLFHTIGYDEPRLNIHQSGREIDLSSIHRTEHKIAIAECKAHTDTIGGADINKFVGALDAERRKYKKIKEYKSHSVIGYFISLSGFKETTIEQEQNFDNSRVILIKPEKIVQELIEGRVLVSLEKAISYFSLAENISLIEYADLIAYEKGWVWVLYFSDSEGQATSHFGLVHAEGKPLLKELADELIALDESSVGLLNNLKAISYINEYNSPDTSELNTAKDKYFDYLENELGDIQFEGLPTDKEAGAVKVKLENIFVPLNLVPIYEKSKDGFDHEVDERVGIGNILSKSTKLAILAKPGGGKSTLIKRIAIAYAFPSRRSEINDNLPDKEWFPIFIRCRELGNKVTDSITNIIGEIPTRAEISQYSTNFSLLVSKALQSGNALLLIDGLDEITEDKNRVAFVNQLRTFIATFPTINIIVTSREAGFRAVGGSLSIYCDHYKVASLIEQEIEELTLKWHKSIIDDSSNTINEAKRLSELIISDNRIRALADNPLLLTTLLFVKRWAGYLPTKRSVLYQEMIKLLLVTWNVEGHDQLDIEEAEPQLAFVAYWMTKKGQQTITEEELRALLIDARKQMPEILGYTNISPSEFIKRVESRSSLLIMSGHKQLDSGLITQLYEFLHLSFQEYLTAKALVKLYIPQADADRGKLELIKSNVNKENWKEVIPLAAVLMEREAKDLIKFLTLKTKGYATNKSTRTNKEGLSVFSLGSCLANEVQITPDLLSTSIEWYIKSKYKSIERGHQYIILNNKFGSSYRKKSNDLFFNSFDNDFIGAIGGSLGEIYLYDSASQSEDEFISSIEEIINNGSIQEKCVAFLGLMEFAFDRRSLHESNSPENFTNLFSNAITCFEFNDSHLTFSLSWCLTWSEEANFFPDDLRESYLNILIPIWLENGEKAIRRNSAWAISKLIIPNYNIKNIEGRTEYIDKIKDKHLSVENEFDIESSIYLCYLLKIPLDKEMIEKFFTSKLRSNVRYSRNKSAREFSVMYGYDSSTKKITNNLFNQY